MPDSCMCCTHAEAMGSAGLEPRLEGAATSRWPGLFVAAVLAGQSGAQPAGSFPAGSLPLELI